ncbi:MULTISPECIES: phage tail protein [unclassified Streptomyces]|uniref:phage tail protein n=1 Tax=unclassified Streptomyces TaxID=2593676 RepID=UPI002E0E648A|nr:MULTISPECIES: hypothetical protein [unclassified Streptomyces]WSJ37397.1 hypothetical protein OG772_16070 [Streptomyces sp. NBC_01321]WSP56371.1 hypothetical protein OG306_19845 [Streptomyces sp. NBC_01241]WSP63794.1 hypothetical protein OG466_19285 [Streptomyces sp. NBC_01240]
MKAVPEKDPASGSGVSGRGGTPPRENVTLTPEVSRSQAPSSHRPLGDRPAPDPRSLQRLQRAAGNAAVSRLVAQRYTAPVKPSPAQAPGFRKVKADVAAKKVRLVAHAPAATESKSAQDAAVAPPDDKEAQGKAANAEKMNAAKPGEFNKQAFIDAVNKAIDAQAPKNLDQADKFSKSGKADKIKDEVDGKVTDGKESSAKDIDTATKAPPDTSAAKDKPVIPMTPDQPPANPGAPPATDAIPAQQPASVTDFSQGPAANDKTMADAEVTEDQLAKGNEPEFNEALSAKKTAETDSAKAPAKGKTAEAQQLNTAKAGAAASGAQAMNALTATRTSAGKHIDGGKGDTKSKDEKRRAEVTAKLQKVYDGTKKDVEETLSGLDKKVDTAFTQGEKTARDAFTADHKRRMKAYKDKRYSGMFGPAKWAKDKLMGMPKEANDLFQEARKLYVAKMQTVISSVADIIGAELGKAKARIAKGRAELKAEVDKLPADLRQFGEDAAKDFAGKFDDLEATVNEKSEQLVQDLATKYTAALNKVDEEIKKLQEANKGLIDKAKDAIVGVIKTINELKNLLLGILAKAASAMMKIIKDPIGFLGNLVKAVGAGLQLFITNVAEHLRTGVVSWLLGTAVKAGLELPQKFDLKGIIQLIGALLGLTWANIRTRITRKGLPDQALAAVEQSVPVAKKLAAEGPAGAVKEIETEAGDLKATILEKLTSYLIPTVIIAGITWIISLLNPASAFIRAVKGIIDIVTFIVNQGAQIVEFVNSVLDAVIAIANGGSAGVPKMVEAALAASVPLLIGFLASLLGIGGLANKVKSVFHVVARPVNRAIDKIVDFITKKGKALWTKLRGKKNNDARGNPDGDYEKKFIRATQELPARYHNLFSSSPSRNEIDSKNRRWKSEFGIRHLSANGQTDRLLIVARTTEKTVGSAYNVQRQDVQRVVDARGLNLHIEIRQMAKELEEDPRVRSQYQQIQDDWVQGHGRTPQSPRTRQSPAAEALAIRENESVYYDEYLKHPIETGEDQSNRNALGKSVRYEYDNEYIEHEVGSPTREQRSRIQNQAIRTRWEKAQTEARENAEAQGRKPAPRDKYPPSIPGLIFFQSFPGDGSYAEVKKNIDTVKSQTGLSDQEIARAVLETAKGNKPRRSITRQPEALALVNNLTRLVMDIEPGRHRGSLTTNYMSFSALAEGEGELSDSIDHLIPMTDEKAGERARNTDKTLVRQENSQKKKLEKYEAKIASQRHRVEPKIPKMPERLRSTVQQEMIEKEKAATVSYVYAKTKKEQIVYESEEQFHAEVSELVSKQLTDRLRRELRRYMGRI